MNRQTEKHLLKSTSIIHTEDCYGNVEQASCFFVAHTSAGAVHHYLVTNKHVLENKVKIHLSLDQYHKETGTCSYHRNITISLHQAVRFHKTCDIAVLNIDFIKNQNTEKDFYSYSTLDTKMIPEHYDDFLNIQPILMLGYPSGIHDTVSNLPVARAGITATPMNNNYKGKAEFLIDIPFLNGSSGSPIFAEINDTVYLVGIEYSKILEKVTEDKCKNRLYRSRKYTVETETGLGIAIRSRQILELIEA